MKKFLAVLLLSTALTACNLAPDYQRPNVQAGNEWKGDVPIAETVDANWWKEFKSDELNGLIDRAAENNTDLAASLQRIDQARAQAKIAGASLYPSAAVNGGYNADNAKNSSSQRSWSVGAAVSYELDLWQGNANTRRAAEYGVNQAVYDQAALALVVTGDTVQRYTEILVLKERIRLTEQNLKTFRETLNVVQARYDQGSASGLELSQQKTTLANAEASLTSLRQQEATTETALAVLLGVAPQDYAPVFKKTLTQLAIPKIAPLQPADLLERRPDLREQEEALKAANADIGVARAALFPSADISASAGLAAVPAVATPAWTTGLAASVAQRIFAGGALIGQVRLSEARQRELVETYRGVVLNAFKETQDALVAVRAAEQREKSLNTALAESRNAYAIAKDRYLNGADDFLTLLDAQRSLLSAQDSVAQARLDRLTAAVTLFKALGGGWKS